jgi:hypothetical protein
MFRDGIRKVSDLNGWPVVELTILHPSRERENPSSVAFEHVSPVDADSHENVPLAQRWPYSRVVDGGE